MKKSAGTIAALFISLILSICPVKALAAISGDFEYMDRGATIEITGYNGTGGNVVIPSEINSKNVTSIGAWAFDGYSGITGVTLPASLRTIDSWAFKIVGIYITCR